MPYFFPIFGLFVIFLAWSAYERRKAERLSKENRDAFWQRELDANSVRKQSLDQLDYITIDENILIDNLWNAHPDDHELLSLSETLASLKEKRIFNLTGMTSTDIKLTYGVANLNELSSYDDNFTTFCKTIYSYGQRLADLGNYDAAITVLEIGIDSLTDISGNYKLLAKLYIEKGTPKKINNLIDKASLLDSLMKNSILSSLNDMLPNIDLD